MLRALKKIEADSGKEPTSPVSRKPKSSATTTTKAEKSSEPRESSKNVPYSTTNSSTISQPSPRKPPRNVISEQRSTKPKVVLLSASRINTDLPQSKRNTQLQQNSVNVSAKSHQMAADCESSSNQSDFGRQVWISHPTEGFVLARITDISHNGLTLVTCDSNETVTRKYNETFACEDDSTKFVDDNCTLMHLNEATLLNNCRQRYQNGKIYSYVANILISVNPYEAIPGFYSSETIKDYLGKSIGQKEPHIFAIADKAYREMRRQKMSQSIIVSGESGAGKTESQKSVLRYLCENWGAEAGPIQQRLLETNPILESFGNAKTLRNNNSSRFGKFVEIHFDDRGKVGGGFISHYLLETSRVCRQSTGERNYHIFYQLIAGASNDLYKHLSLAPPAKFNYLKHGCPAFYSNNQAQIDASRVSDIMKSTDAMLDDVRDFERLCRSMDVAGLDANQQTFIWNTIGGILHLGNVEFEENLGDSRGGCRVSASTEDSLATAARLLGLQMDEMKLGLCARIMQATKGGVKGTLIRVPLKPHEAVAGRDALAKAIYSKLFDWLVTMINKSIPFEKSAAYIGVLDVAGFEYFAVNSFEQFCINYCNEKLQHFFNERILKQEQQLYESEGLKVPKIDFADNDDCIELFERKATGLFDLLDEEARLPRATPQHFTQRAHEANAKHFRLDTPRKSKIKAHREMRDEEGLMVRHYAGSVCYETRLFVDKNNDQLHNSLEMLIEQSTCQLLVQLFANSDSGAMKTGRLRAASVGGKFKQQLATLLDKLHQTGTHFVRCVKPNNEMKPWKFDGVSIMGQLACAGMPSVLKLMHNGFPSRCSFAELYAMYQSRLPPNLVRLDPRMFVKCLFRALGLDTSDYQFGMTRVFFRAGKFAEFDEMMRQDVDTMSQLIGKVSEWLNKARWRKAQYGAWSVIKLQKKIEYRREMICYIQSKIRGYLVRKRFQKRLSIYRKACALLDNSREMTDILSRMNAESQEKWRQTANETTQQLEQLVASIKQRDDDCLQTAIDAYEQCVKRVDSIIADLKQQLETDELAEMERKRAEQEAREKKEREEREAAERERALRKKMEEERERAQKELEEQMAEKKRLEELERAEMEKRREKEERERLDAAVSSSLASSDGLALVPVEQPAPVSAPTTAKASKYDLSNWKYAELRDAINNSQDIELLMACKEEFHRRLRIYNEWKSRNASKKDLPQTRAPGSIYPQKASVWSSTSSSSSSSMASTSRTAAPQLNPALVKQRYFKVSYPNRNKGVVQTGMWYAHFNGQYVQRQLNLHPGQKPMVLVTGRDDFQMCELPLEQTGLTTKKGAEITEHEFETIWQHYGGKPMTSWKP